MKPLQAVVVDDNRLNRELVVRTLEVQGVATLQAGEAKEALKLIQLSRPDLVILDIMLPGDLDGVDLCRIIRTNKKLKQPLVVMITAADKKREMERALAAGADILIPKPFSPTEFWSQIKSMLGKREHKTKYKILIVEDDETDARLAEQVLSRAGYEVFVKLEASGVIGEVKKIQPHLILLDVMMPSISGEDIARLIAGEKNLKQKPLIVFYSNKSASELRILAQKTRAHGFICKIEGPSALVNGVASVIEEHLEKD